MSKKRAAAQDPLTRSARAGYAPLDVAILGIDTAAVSGWAVRIKGRLTASGEIDSTRDEHVTWVLDRARAAAAAQGVPLVCVLETAYGGNRHVLLGLGAARERWMRALRAAKVPKHRILSVLPNTWRKAVFGGYWSRQKRRAIRAHELAMAQAETGVRGLGPDEAAAIGISRWGAQAAPVRAAMGAA